jgi:anti-sigma regulatory factor (Ser/Thr protein kinase)
MEGGDVTRLDFGVERSAEASRRVRRELSDWMATIDCPEQTAYDALLVVSELVTNAIVHADSDPRVVVTFDEGRLRIEVHDHGAAPPQVRPKPGPDGGYGLRVVAAAADGWGWVPTSTGKVVWTEMLC